MRNSRSYREVIFPNHRHLKKDECFALFKIYNNPSIPLDRRIRARNYLIECSQKFIKKFVDAFWNNHRDKNYIDLWQAAQECFIIAFEKADINKLQDIKFDTHASYWMLASMSEASKNDGVIRYAYSHHQKMNNDNKEMRKKMKTASITEIRRMLNDFDTKWGNFRNNSGSNILSLDQKTSENNRKSNITIGDTVATDENYSSSHILGRNMLRQGLHGTISRLSSIEQKVIKATYGVEDKGSDFNQLSYELGIPKNKVMKIRNDALIKMKKDKEFKQILSSLNMMASITNGSNVFAFLNKY